MTVHPSPIMGFHVDAERTGLPAFSFEESLNAIHVEKGMLGAQKGRLANTLMSTRSSVCFLPLPSLSLCMKQFLEVSTQWVGGEVGEGGQVTYRVKHGIGRKDKKWEN